MIKSSRPLDSVANRYEQQRLSSQFSGLSLGGRFAHATNPPLGQAAENKPAGTLENPIIDSKLTRAEALEGVDPACPKEILDRQALVEVKYYGDDGLVHQGQLVLDERLVKDVNAVFELAFKEKFPIHSVIPIADKRFCKEGKWEDGLSMAANNTSSFNYRFVAGTTRLSNHARGMAIDLNPLINPWIKEKQVEPPQGSYDPKVPGTLTEDSLVTKKFLELGWGWGGRWLDSKDYQHFDKVVEQEENMK